MNFNKLIVKETLHTEKSLNFQNLLKSYKPRQMKIKKFLRK